MVDAGADLCIALHRTLATRNGNSTKKSPTTSRNLVILEVYEKRASDASCCDVKRKAAVNRVCLGSSTLSKHYPEAWPISSTASRGPRQSPVPPDRELVAAMGGLFGMVHAWTWMIDELHDLACGVGDLPRGECSGSLVGPMPES
jgi:hypothetical protein